MVYNVVPYLSHAKCFGCLAFASTNGEQRAKLSHRATKFAFLGYKDEPKGYTLFDRD
ncbi:hypothetical protein LR48_Vigan01g270400 [Vigna angularis]|uniref:Retroviral polymerase SH3-like domain-containing protein n=1 Tax=Phaseolus angularis TaxID=3914 RepID=A0A0L9TRD4_PHAAN|nr:hypothetical protein LR48_Vigan01g270400 [Vigna angularis]